MVRSHTAFQPTGRWEHLQMKLSCFGRALAFALSLPISTLAITGLSAQVTPDDWHQDGPGVRRLITAADLPKPYATSSASNTPNVVAAPIGVRPAVPNGFAVEPYVTGLENPRAIRVAANGDIFVAETGPGRIRILRGRDGQSRPETVEVFAENLDAPFGIAFYPAGLDPHWIYIANNNAILRYPYHLGALRPDGPPETVVAPISATSQGHTTRDIAFSLDGRRMFVSVGSESNVAQGLAKLSPEQIGLWQGEHGLGAAWGAEVGRADVLVFDPDGKNEHILATGLRNCAGIAVHPATGDLWCATNERDGLGDNLPPDYVTRVAAGGFYGWPWFYIGGNQDPRHPGERPDLTGHVLMPDVLLQPHSAPLQLTFYQAQPDGMAAFPSDYDGDAFVALHGSWNRGKRTGYKVVRVRLHGGVPIGGYEDFLTGFVVNDDSVWGRPVGVAVAHDGALLITEDGNGTLWRVAYRGAR
jgi:glucose/arabinose dehydrogenase